MKINCPSCNHTNEEGKNREDLIRELQAHQVELEMQNKELRRAQAELEQCVAARTEELRQANAELGVELTKSKQGKEVLWDQFHFLQQVLDAIPIPIFYKDRQGLYRGCNMAYEKFLGMTKERIIGKTVFEVVPQDLANIYYRADEALFTQPGIQVYETSFLDADGKEHDIIFHKATYAGTDRCVAGLLGAIVDITDRKQAEETLRRISAHQESLLSSIPDIIMETDSNKVYTWANEAGMDFFGEDVVGKEASFYFEGDQETYSTVNPLFNGSANIIDLESWQRRKDGEKRLLFWRCRVLKDDSGRVTGALSSAHDITDRRQMEEKLLDSLESLRKAIGVTIQVMVSAVEKRDPYTAGHQSRSANLARAIATEMGLSADRVDGIRIAASIHDIGNLSIPAEILSKPAKLSEVEFSLIKEHARQGFEILQGVESPWPLAEIVFQHHERMDGSGYPRHLKGDDILPESRILAVADVVAAISSHRPYRPALGTDAALEEISKNRGVLYDPEATDACLRLFREKGYSLN